MVSTLQIYKVLLIELVERARLYDSIYEDFTTCKDLIFTLQPYFDMKELPLVAPEELFAGYEGDLKEMLINAEPILKGEYGYTVGFQSLVKATRRLYESYFSMEHVIYMVERNFSNYVMEHFKENLDEFILNPGPKTAAETGFRQLMHELTTIKKNEDESINRERKARRNYYLKALNEAGSGDDVPTPLELETGFAIWYESIISDVLTVGKLNGPV